MLGLLQNFSFIKCGLQNYYHAVLICIAKKKKLTHSSPITIKSISQSVTSCFAYKLIRLHRGRFAYTTQVVSPTRSESIRLHWSRFAYTNRNSSYTKGTVNLKWYVCTPNSFVEANSRLSSVRHKLILFCCTRETSSRIFLSPVLCAYIEFYKITELLRRSHWSIAVFRWEYVNTVVTF